MNYLFETSRLRFRAMTIDDVDAMIELNSDPEVVRYTGDSAFPSREAATDFFRERIQLYKEDGYGRWIVELKETGEIIGWCGLKLHRDTNETDLGYRLFRKFWNNGFGHEASLATIDFAFNRLSLKRISAEARKENIASWRIMEKCGMKFLRNSKGCDGETVIYEIYSR
jgi:RimJ/RimL family protein N-acetyltransferase